MPPREKKKKTSKRVETKESQNDVDIRDSQGFAVGDNNTVIINNGDEKAVKQFSLVQKLGFAGVVIAIIGVGVWLFLGLRPERKEIMTGEFRIAVVGFYEDGKNLPDKIGYTIADGMKARLDADLKEITVGPKVQIWGPDDIDENIKGNTPQERAENAEKLAKQIHAHMVVYGVVVETQSGIQVIPEFYLDTQGFHEGSEVIGQYELGSPFPLPGADNPSWQFDFDKQMKVRTDIISSFAKGLTYFAVHNYTDALIILQSIEGVEGWQDNQGKEVLYALIGFAAGKAEQYDLTKSSLEKAISINPKYARPYIGLANLNYVLSIKPFEKSQDIKDVDQILLDKCFEYLKLAEDAPGKPPLAEVETKIHFARGQCYWLKTYTGKLPDFNLAVNEFEYVITAYQDGANPRVYEYAGESYGRMALIYKLTNQLPRAAEYYQKAINILADIPERQAIYQKRLDDINKALAQPTP